MFRCTEPRNLKPEIWAADLSIVVVLVQASRACSRINHGHAHEATMSMLMNVSHEHEPDPPHEHEPGAFKCMLLVQPLAFSSVHCPHFISRCLIFRFSFAVTTFPITYIYCNEWDKMIHLLMSTIGRT